MSTNPSIWDPEHARARVLGKKASGKRRDAGFSLIETMAAMAVVAILILAALPQFSKYFERASVQNLAGDVANAALTVESDYSLSGKAKYVLGTATTAGSGVAYSVASSNKGAGVTLTPTIDTNGYGYVIKGTVDDVTNYCVKYVSQGTGAGLQITAKATPTATCS